MPIRIKAKETLDFSRTSSLPDKPGAFGIMIMLSMRLTVLSLKKGRKGQGRSLGKLQDRQQDTVKSGLPHRED